MGGSRGHVVLGAMEDVPPEPLPPTLWGPPKSQADHTGCLQGLQKCSEAFGRPFRLLLEK